MASFFRILIILAVIALPFTGFGQRKSGKNFKYRVSTAYKVRELLSVFGSVGTANYYGDLCDNFACIHPRPNIGAGVIYRLSDKVSSKSELNYLRLASNDVWPGRNFSFRSGNVELYTSIMYDYYEFTKNMRKRKLLSPYIFAGLGLVTYNPRAELNGKWYNLRSLRTEGKSYGFLTPIIPIGIGVKIKHTRSWDFLAEAGYRITFTDHIDDVSSFKFKPLGEFDKQEAAELSNRTGQGDAFQGYRGNPKKNDGYVVVSVKARYTFTSKNVYRNKYQEQHRKVY
jgi:hypothetical protein